MIDAIIIILFTLLPLIIVGGTGYAIYRWRKAGKVRNPPELRDKIIVFKNNCSVEMLNYMLNAQGGFTPTAVAPPMR